MTVERVVISGTYQDSVTLMRISEAVGTEFDLDDSFAVMGTEANMEILAEAGLLDAGDRNDVQPDDLILVARAENAEVARQAVAEMETRLRERGRTPGSTTKSSEQPPRSIAAAVDVLDGPRQLALVSVPGEYAAREAWHALHRDLHVHVFSDGVDVETERALKKHGHDHDRLVMGPDCGTAIIGGTPLGFANEVRTGRIGIVAASGTGLQEVASLIHRGGAGISHAIGTGSRDLTDAVGGLTTRQGLELLATHRGTDVIVLVSKPPDPTVRDEVLDHVRGIDTPTVIDFLGESPEAIGDAGTAAVTLEETAQLALEATEGAETPNRFDAGVLNFTTDADTRVTDRAADLAADREFIRGLFSGGTLCTEAALLLEEDVGTLSTNVGVGRPVEDPLDPSGNALVDLGTDDLTRGRPHPMIDPRRRRSLLEETVASDDVAVVLLDVVLGHGVHGDPAGVLAEALPADEHTGPLVIASVCGTDGDPQSLTDQVTTLAEAGAFVTPSNAQAARLATTALAAVPADGGDQQ